MSKKIHDTASFIKKAEEVHDHKYDYSKVEYVNAKTKVTIICPVHGEFQQMPNNHLHNHGCSKCAAEYIRKKKTRTVDEFIAKAISIHGDKYDYSKVKYVNSKTPVAIICKTHNYEFRQTPPNHANLRHPTGCPLCANESRGDKLRLGREEFIAKSVAKHGDKYGYDEVVYVDNATPVKIYCRTCGEYFEQSPYHHMSGSGCNKCSYRERGLKKRKTTEEFIKEATIIHKGRYDYSKVVYEGNTKKVTIICPEHGEFEQTPKRHLKGQGCPVCAQRQQDSREEREVYEFVRAHYDGEVCRNRRDVLDNGQELDIYVPDLDFSVEFNGDYFHSAIFKTPDYHLNKTKESAKKGIMLFHVFSDEWGNSKEIVKSMLLERLNKTPNILRAEDCVIETVDKDLANNFLDKNHIQGKSDFKYCYGLFHNGALVSLMSFKRNNGRKKCYEIKRFCNILNTKVIDGPTRLFSHFKAVMNPYEVVVSVDRRWDDGALYKQMGFVLSHEIEPDYTYTNGHKRFNKSKIVTKRIISEAKEKGVEVDELLEANYRYRLYDCGQLCLVWKKQEEG